MQYHTSQWPKMILLRTYVTLESKNVSCFSSHSHTLRWSRAVDLPDKWHREEVVQFWVPHDERDTQHSISLLQSERIQTQESIGLYTLVPSGIHVPIHNANVVRWNLFVWTLTRYNARCHTRNYRTLASEYPCISWSTAVIGRNKQHSYGLFMQNPVLTDQQDLAWPISKHWRV